MLDWKSDVGGTRRMVHLGLLIKKLYLLGPDKGRQGARNYHSAWLPEG